MIIQTNTRELAGSQFDEFYQKYLKSYEEREPLATQAKIYGTITALLCAAVCAALLYGGCWMVVALTGGLHG